MSGRGEDHARLLAQARELTYKCIRCGFCLPACPTYRETLLETESPRGRIALVRAASEGELAVGEVLAHLDLCIGCRGCETACPAGVRYGSILEAFRGASEPVRRRRWVERWARRVGFDWVLGRPAGIRLGAWAWRVYRAVGLRRVEHALGILRRLAPAMGELEAILPGGRRRPAGSAVVDAASRRAGRVAFFRGCVQSIALDEVNEAAVRVLRAAGFEVLEVAGQGCCGAVHAHAGHHASAIEQARRNVAAFERVDADYVVSVAGGCGAALKEYPKWFEEATQHRGGSAAAAGGARPGHDGGGDGASDGHTGRVPDGQAWVERATRFAGRVRDFTELLASAELPELGPVDGVVTYQDSCHLRNVQKVADAPRRLLKQVPGLRFVELPEADRCCGAGGIYNITEPHMSRQILDRKMDQVRSTGATILAVANTPCHLQMLLGARRSGLEAGGLRVRHVAEILDEAIHVARQGGIRSRTGEAGGSEVPGAGVGAGPGGLARETGTDGAGRAGDGKAHTGDVPVRR